MFEGRRPKRGVETCETWNWESADGESLNLGISHSVAVKPHLDSTD